MIRSIASSLLILFIILAPLAPAQTAPKNVRPGTILLSAYQTVQEAEKLEGEKLHKDAWNKYHQALRYYQTLSSAHPTWKPHIVNGRIESTTESIARVEPMAQKQFMIEQAKLKDFVEGQSGHNTSEIPDPKSAVFTPKEQKKLGSLNKRIIDLEKQLRDQKNQHTADKLKLTERVARLQDELRRSSQGLARENPNTRRLNAEITRLQRELVKSQQLGNSNQQQLMKTIEELQQTRDTLATAPLRQDVEKLKLENKQQQQELRLLAQAQIKTTKLLDRKKRENETLIEQNKLTKGLLEQKTLQLEQAQNTSSKLVKAMRVEVKQLKSQLASAQQTIEKQNKEIDGLIRRLADANSINEELRSDLEAITRERDQISELLKLSDADRAKQLMQENLRLGQELSKAMDNLKLLSSDKNSTQDRLIEAENDLAIAKQQVIYLRDEKNQLRKRTTQLEKLLRTTQLDLANKSSQQNIDQIAQEEITELKQTVKRLLIHSTRRRKAEQLLWNEYQKIAKGDALIDKGYLSLNSDNLELSQRERDLLRDNASIGSYSLPNRGVNASSRVIAQQKAETKIETYHALARRFLEKDNLLIAKDIYDEAYETIPDYSFLINRGVVRMRLGETEQAADIFSLGISQRPKSPYLHFMLGMARFHMHDDDLAAKSIDTAIDLRPDYPVAYLYRGLIEASNARHKKALDFLQSAVRLDPEYHEAHYNLAILHQQMGNLNEARNCYNNALRSGLPPVLDFEKLIKAGEATP